MSVAYTPRGLPYPNGDEPVYTAPTHLQALAESVEAKLNAAGAGQVFSRFSAPVTADGGTNSGYTLVTTPEIKWVRGAVAQTQTVNGQWGPYMPAIWPAWLYYQPTDSGAAPYVGKVRLYILNPYAVQESTPPGQKDKQWLLPVVGGGIGIQFIAWGDPYP